MHVSFLSVTVFRMNVGTCHGKKCEVAQADGVSSTELVIPRVNLRSLHRLRVMSGRFSRWHVVLSAIESRMVSCPTARSLKKL